ncbi:MAG TPA: Fur family transcriptional regulator [Candidatus Nanopelagicaceae bacterium]|nr:Fur family transcriptional regulator [Candidatus Nanopelagicaceae bacterium]
MSGDTASNEIRQRGLRLTPQRELVLAAVRELGHSTPEEISAQVRKHHPGINLSTVYRNLETLERAGFVVHSHLGHGGATFHAADEASHLHLVCGSCGNVSEAELSLSSDFVAKLVDEHGFHTDITHFAIFGQCAECSKK